MRYHGGKWMLAPWIIRHLPRHRVYVEPFGGAGSVLLRKHRSHAEVYNDLDSEVVNVFRVLRDPTLAEQLRRAVALTPWSREEFDGSYEMPSSDLVEAARRRILRSFMSHGSTSTIRYRTGFRSVCYAQRKAASLDWAGWPEHVPAFVERLAGVVIEHRPALELIDQHDGPETLFYVDPPYPISTRSSIRWRGDEGRAYAVNLSDDEHRELAAALWRIRGMAVVSSYPSPLYDEIFAGWERVTCETLADGAKERTEVLWISPNAAAARVGSLW